MSILLIISSLPSTLRAFTFKLVEKESSLVTAAGYCNPNSIHKYYQRSELIHWVSIYCNNIGKLERQHYESTKTHLQRSTGR